MKKSSLSIWHYVVNLEILSFFVAFLENTNFTNCVDSAFRTKWCKMAIIELLAMKLWKYWCMKMFIEKLFHPIWGPYILLHLHILLWFESAILTKMYFVILMNKTENHSANKLDFGWLSSSAKTNLPIRHTKVTSIKVIYIATILWLITLIAIRRSNYVVVKLL